VQEAKLQHLLSFESKFVTLLPSHDGLGFYCLLEIGECITSLTSQFKQLGLRKEYR